MLAAGILEPVVVTDPGQPSLFAKGSTPIVKTRLSKLGPLDDNLALYDNNYWTNIKHDLE